MLPEQIGRNIRRLRQENDLTQHRLAELLCVSHQMISRYENSVTIPDIGTLIRLSSIFRVSLDVLCGLADSDKENLIRHLQQSYSEQWYGTYALMAERYAAFLQEAEPVMDDDRVLHLQLSLLADMHDAIQTDTQLRETNEMILECAGRILDISRDDPLRSFANTRLAIYYDETPFDSPDYQKNRELSRKYAGKILLCTYFPEFTLSFGTDMRTAAFREIQKSNLHFFGKKFRGILESMRNTGQLSENEEKYKQLSEILRELDF